MQVRAFLIGFSRNCTEIWLPDLFAIRLSQHFILAFTRPMAVDFGSPLRVALFTGAYTHIADGVSLTLNRAVRYLLTQGLDVRVFAPEGPTRAFEPAGTVVPVPSISAPGRPEYRVSIGFSARVRETLDTFAPHLIHIATPDVLGLVALRYARRLAIPVVATYHTHFASYLDYYGLGKGEAWLWRYLRWFYGHCDATLVPSSTMQDVLASQGITRGVTIWARGVEADRFSPSNRDLAWRASLGIAPDVPAVLFAGRLVWEKGLTVYADVIEKLQDASIPHASVVVGDGPARADLQRRLTQTHFVGHQDKEGLARAYASSEVFLFPSETETFGNVTLEAMASGLPCVCAQATGSGSLVVHGETGFLVPARNSTAFFDAVSSLVRDADLRAQMGNASRARALSFDWQVILPQLVSAYQAVLRTPSRA